MKQAADVQRHQFHSGPTALKLMYTATVLTHSLLARLGFGIVGTGSVHREGRDVDLGLGGVGRRRGVVVRLPGSVRSRLKGSVDDKDAVRHACGLALAAVDVGREVELAKVAEGEVLVVSRYVKPSTPTNLGEVVPVISPRRESANPGRASMFPELSLYL